MNTTYEYKTCVFLQGDEAQRWLAHLNVSGQRQMIAEQFVEYYSHELELDDIKPTTKPQWGSDDLLADPVSFPGTGEFIVTWSDLYVGMTFRYETSWFLVCHECGESFDSMETAALHQLNDIDTHEDSNFEYRLLPESEAM